MISLIWYWWIYIEIIIDMCVYMVSIHMCISQICLLREAREASINEQNHHSNLGFC